MIKKQCSYVYILFFLKFDREKFEDLYTDMKWLEGRTGRSAAPGKRNQNRGGKVRSPS